MKLPGTLVTETHPSLIWYKCVTGNGCQQSSSPISGKVVLDANWRWYHTVNGHTNCFSTNTWNTAVCPDPATCIANCALEGANYVSDFGISTSLNSVRMKWTSGSSTAPTGSRIYLLQNDNAYQIFKPLSQEFSVDVDLSTVPCGMTASIRLSEMAADGGMSTQSTNTAGAKYGTYCDAKCPRELKFVNGQVNELGWTVDSNGIGYGNYGACCSEVDLFEGNSVSSDFAGHSCLSSVIGSYACTVATCGTTSGGVCDPLGCEFNSYRNGATGFYGPAKTINTNQKFTVVTQFITNTGTALGTLKEIRRLWVQNDVIIQNVATRVSGVTATNPSPQVIALRKRPLSTML
ncbi:hypothetical protein FRB90_005958 [Tulasnella sp. 427]|nr:hypothetical protein FRB90_005958 [Tulasnella sp. 427]